MLAPIEIHAPRTIPDASALLRHYGDEAAVYAGGTELLIVIAIIAFIVWGLVGPDPKLAHALVVAGSRCGETFYAGER